MMTIVRPRSTQASRGVVLAILSVALVLLAIGQAFGDWAFLGSVAALLGSLGWAGIRWGADTRDGADWKPRRPL
jgi:hypothetical protein